MPWYRINQHWKNTKFKRKEGIDYAYTCMYTLTVLAQLYVIHYATHTFNKLGFIMQSHKILAGWKIIEKWAPYCRDTRDWLAQNHYGDFIMGTIASQITSLTVVYSTVYSDAVQRKHQSSASLAFVWGIHRGPVNSPHKWPVTRKMFPFDEVIMFDRAGLSMASRQP